MMPKKRSLCWVLGAFTLASSGLVRPALFGPGAPDGVAWAATDPNAKLSGDLAKAIRAGDLEAVKEALANGADLNALDERKMPPIGAAALLGKTDIVEYLADKGADVNRQDGYGFTPLMCAAQRGQSGAVRALLKRGADPAMKGGNNEDAMAVAQPRGPADPLIDGKEAVIKLLKEALARKGGAPAAVAPEQKAATAPPQVPPPQPKVPLLPLGQSALVVRNADGTLGVGQKNGQPIDAVKVSTHDAADASPSIAVGPDGTIHVAFNEIHGTQTAVYHRSSADGGKTWSEQKNLSEDEGSLNVGRCQVLVDPKNRAYVIWRVGIAATFPASLDPAGGYCNLVYRVLEDGKWSKIIPVHPPASSETQHEGSLSFYAAVDPMGRVQVAWNTLPNKWHDEVVSIRSLGNGKVWRAPSPYVGAGLIFQTTLDGSTAAPPHEAFMSAVTNKTDPIGPTCDGLDTINGYFDAAGEPHFVAKIAYGHAVARHDTTRYQIVEDKKLGPAIELPDLSYHAGQSPPTLLTDAAGAKHIIVLNPVGEHPRVVDYAVGSTDEPTVIGEAAEKGSVNGMQAFEGPNGRMAVAMEINNTGVQEPPDLFVSVSTGGGKWSPPVNVTNNASRRTLVEKRTGLNSGVLDGASYAAGPTALAFDAQGHLLLLTVQQEKRFFLTRQGGLGWAGESSTPSIRFLKL